MASLQTSTVATSMAVAGNTVWTNGNMGGTARADTGLDADQIWGYNRNYFDIPSRIDATVTVGGSTGTYYPMIFTQDDWDAGGGGTPLIMDVRRTNPNQDGTGYGVMFAKIKYRATNWGFHQNHWEVMESYGSGNQYPFIANIAQPGTANYLAVWMRGGCSFSFSFGTRATLFDTSTKATKGGWNSTTQTSTTGDGWAWESTGLTGGGISTQTTQSLPTNAHYYQQDLCSKGYDLGQGGFRASNVYVTTKTISSDGRYKDNLDVSFGLEFLELLKPTSYQWIGGKPDTKHHYGFIAQEVKEVMDKLGIAESDFAGYDSRNPEHLALSYDQFIPILITAIQEEENIMTGLKERVSKLELAHGNV
jgi:hypothetical protein